MDKWIYGLITKLRRIRSERLLGVARFFIRGGITANMMTCFSFLLGLGAVYSLFQQHLWFVILGILHLVVDGLDGVIARATTPTQFGKYLDHISDQLIGIFLLLKVALITGDTMVYLVLVLVFLSQLLYTLSHLQAPTLFPRTFLLLPLMANLLTLGVLIAGVIGLYSLALQLKWILERRFAGRVPK